MYIRRFILPPFCLSFLSSLRNVLYFYPIQLLLSSPLVPSIPPPPLSSPAKPPVLVQPSQACPAKFLPLPYREFPGPRFRSLPAVTQVLWDYLKEMLELGKIRPSKSPAAVPIIFVPKAHSQELRLCVDYCGLNKVTIAN
jgi:hypothetical protein